MGLPGQTWSSRRAEERRQLGIPHSSSWRRTQVYYLARVHKSLAFQGQPRRTKVLVSITACPSFSRCPVSDASPDLAQHVSGPTGRVSRQVKTVQGYFYCIALFPATGLTRSAGASLASTQNRAVPQNRVIENYPDRCDLDFTYWIGALSLGPNSIRFVSLHRRETANMPCHDTRARCRYRNDPSG
jgi:hypothetical protein